MTRRLTPGEARMWSLVTRTVRPLDLTRGSVPPLPDCAPASLPLGADRRGGKQSVGEKPGRAYLARPLTSRLPNPDAASLDNGWDKRIRRGLLSPDRVLDLHGDDRIRAHQRVEAAILDLAAAQRRLLLVVTGKGRHDSAEGGVLRRHLPLWLSAEPLRSRVIALRPAHKKHGGTGAFYVILRRKSGGAVDRRMP